MIRTVITPDQQNISIKVPKDFIGKIVEIIAFTHEETVESSVSEDNIATHFVSEGVLAKDWLTSEEDMAWKSL
jgi:hypothetical protein